MPTLIPAREDDHARITAAIASWWDTPGFDDEAARRERAALVPRLWLQHFGETCWLAIDGETLVGFLIGFFSTSRPAEAYIHFVGVSPTHRRAGLGTRLYENFFAQARAARRDTVRAITSPGNVRSISFHTALGFAREAGDPELQGAKRDYDGPGLHRVCFVRALEV